MNIYDTKSLVCAKCETFIGEIDWDAHVIRPLCGKCASPVPDDDKILYTKRYYKNNYQKKEIFQTIRH